MRCGRIHAILFIDILCPLLNGCRVKSSRAHAAFKSHTLALLSFQLPSGHGAHVPLGALHRQFDKDGQEEMVAMIFHPDKSDLRPTVSVAKAALAHLLGLAQEFMGLSHSNAEIRDLLL
jgi:hypothetical protein